MFSEEGFVFGEGLEVSSHRVEGFFAVCSATSLCAVAVWFVGEVDGAVFESLCFCGIWFPALLLWVNVAFVFLGSDISTVDPADCYESIPIKVDEVRSRVSALFLRKHFFDISVHSDVLLIFIVSDF